MSSTKNKVDNPFVYPVLENNRIGNPIKQHFGITLRDQIAISVLPTVLKEYLDKAQNGIAPDLLAKYVTGPCYKIADAMLLERGEEEDRGE